MSSFSFDLKSTLCPSSFSVVSVCLRVIQLLFTGPCFLLCCPACFIMVSVSSCSHALYLLFLILLEDIKFLNNLTLKSLPFFKARSRQLITAIFLAWQGSLYLDWVSVSTGFVLSVLSESSSQCAAHLLPLRVLLLGF